MTNVSHTSALERDERRSSHSTRFGRAEILFVATSLVGLLAIGLAYSGRIQRLRATPSERLTNLNTLSDAVQLEPALLVVSGPAPEGRLAAQELYHAIQALRSAGDELPNVGAIVSLRRFTASDLATLKPWFVVRTADEFRRRILVNVGLLFATFYGVVGWWRVRGSRGDLTLLTVAHLLTALGFALLVSRQDPLRDALLFERYTHGVCVGLGLMAIVSLVDFQRAAFLELSYLPLIVALCLSAVLIAFGTGPGTSAAKVNLGPVQPIEAIRLLLALFLAGYFARRWELLRQIRSLRVRRYRLPAWLNLPQAEYVVPVVAGVAAALTFFFFQKDLGPALFVSCVFLAMYGVARSRALLAVAGLTLLVAGFYVGYRLNVSETLAERVRMWQSPWDNAAHGGDQVAHAIWALGTGGMSGTGLGLGDTRYLPAGHTDLVLAAIGEELGLVGLLVVFASYALVGWRGFHIARSAANDYGFFLAVAATLFLVLPVLVMAAGLLGITPLTGVVTPFLSYGGSAMAANFAALGMLGAIETRRQPNSIHEHFDLPLRWLGGVLALAGVALVVVLVNVQVVHADQYAVKPHLAVQADGERRYQYNPRVLEVARAIDRGSVSDRNGLVLATSNPELAGRSGAQYREFGLNLNATCKEPIQRCYPLGGMTFHLLGDSSTRINWSASNSSYVERDAEDRLRGFDDRATTVRTGERNGRPTFATRRDYRDLVPLVRHRYNRRHRTAVAVLTKARDVRLTIDARFQLRVAELLATYARKSPSGKAAAIVLDPDSGDVLATVSYPWPSLDPTDQDPETAGDAFLDRARYGLYPPGSTFKLVTAAAALRRDAKSQRRMFTCSRLPDGRVGARVPGWSRPVRDDVLETHPHGTIDMHDGVVRSCNAYFAQLAATVGPEALAETANQVGVSVAAANKPERLRATLPQAGYGQGDVVATPLKMARVAAAIASGGVLRDPKWLREQAAIPAKTNVWLPPDAAALLAGYMRDAVLNGTGRSLKNHPGRIAGKTGTAEVAGAPSHSWFVGFAPYGKATKRIAFAVLIENSGYGSYAAAPLSGDIVAAARALGIIQ